MRRIRLILAASGLGLVGAGIVVGQVIAQSGGTPAAVRQPLAQAGKVKGAKGRTLELSRVVIPSGATIALHHHEGTQTAYIQSGVLTYTVQSGSVKVRKGPSDEPKLVRRITAGQTKPIKAGQWIVEQPSDIHMAANRGKKKIVIYLAALLKTGAPASTPN
jgi:oxalate decarboxylase/phosphoglucose isomerase-like protein (cupin superfamily)